MKSRAELGLGRSQEDIALGRGGAPAPPLLPSDRYSSAGATITGRVRRSIRR